MLDINDLSLLKITKVIDWAINFDYDGVHYLIHSGGEFGEGSWQELYIRHLDENGHYELEQIGYKYMAEENVRYDYCRNYNKCLVYSQIDKEYFAYKLTRYGFASGIMEERIRKEDEHNKTIWEQINVCRQKIAELEKDIIKT